MRESVTVIGFWRFIYLRFFYRMVMRVIHRWGWHDMTRCGPPGDQHEWCQWCGVRATVGVKQ